MTARPPADVRRAGRLPYAALSVGVVFAAAELLSVPVVSDALAVCSAPLAAAVLVVLTPRMPAERRRPWALLAATMVLTGIADIIYGVVRAKNGGEAPAVSVADVFYLAGYPVMIAGLVAFLIRGSRRSVRDVMVDASAVAILLGIALWQMFVVSPGLLVTGSVGERIVAVLYPVGDVVVIGGIVALALAAVRTAAVRWLLTYGLFMLVADLVYLSTFQFRAMEGFLPVSSAFYDLTYWSLVAAALSDLRRPAAAPVAPAERQIRRLPLLAIALLGAPALAVTVIALGNRSLVPVFLGAILAISVLVLIRLVGLVRGLERERQLLTLAEERLAHEATHDALTGLPNRSLLATSLPEMVDLARRDGNAVTVVFLDLDEFKQVNDTLGHHAGDALLREVGARITAEMAPGDLVARVGGDEFVLISRAPVDDEAAAALSERLLAAIQAPMYLGEHRVQTSASIGHATLAGDVDHHVLLRNADLALFDAKAAGRRTSRRFTPSLRSAADERAQIERGLRAALDGGGLAVVYQPRVSLDTGAVRSVEALLRWPDRPDVAVPRLIQIAEETGLIREVGSFVMDRTVAEIARHNAGAPQPLGVAVNVSMRQLLRDDLVGEVEDTLARHRLEHRHLTLEITETFISREPDRAHRGLSQLHDLGVQVDVDDFGTGYSSFLRLTQLPIDGIKIDQTFARALGEDRRAGQMVAAMVALARAADLVVTIEGIEKPVQLDAARELGCDLAQGYLISRPVPRDQVPAIVREATANGLGGARPLGARGGEWI